MARNLGITISDLSRWENGKNAPSPRSQHKLAVELDVPPWWFEVPHDDDEQQAVA